MSAPVATVVSDNLVAVTAITAVGTVDPANEQLYDDFANALHALDNHAVVVPITVEQTLNLALHPAFQPALQAIARLIHTDIIEAGVRAQEAVEDSQQLQAELQQANARLADKDNTIATLTARPPPAPLLALPALAPPLPS